MLLLEKLPVQEKEMQENELRDLEKLQVGESEQAVLAEEEPPEDLQEEELHEELPDEHQEDEQQYEEHHVEDVKPPPIFLSISLNYFIIFTFLYGKILFHVSISNVDYDVFHNLNNGFFLIFCGVVCIYVHTKDIESLIRRSYHLLLVFNV